MTAAVLTSLGNGSVIFVPGIMGSELRLRGRYSTGIPRDQVVWGESFTDVLMTLARGPEILSSPELVATRVIREMRFGRIKVRKVYGPLLDFCTASSGLDLCINRSLYPFAYDWRRDLGETANELAALVERVPTPVFIVGHSMGGLISQILMNLDRPAAQRVRGLFLIGCPTGGSSKAFISLKRNLSLGPISDWVWQLLDRLDTGRRVRLMEALRNMPSLYQLLPPAEEKILLQRGGRQRPALDAFQGTRDKPMVRAALALQDCLVPKPSIRIHHLYSAHRKTAWLLAIDENWNFVASGRKAEGDGTVTSASALSHSGDNVTYQGVDAEHTQLCSCNEVFQALRGFLS